MNALLSLMIAAAPLAEVKVEEKLGAQIPNDLLFTDHRGEPVRFSDLGGRRPIVLVLAYYRCPMLCSLVQNGVGRTLAESEAQAGRDFDLVTISFDPDETPADAAKRRASVREESWRFLVGDAGTIDRLLDVTGVSVAKDPSTGQWAHAAVYLMLTPDRRLSRYFYGFDIPPAEFEMALADASRGKSKPSLAQILLRCFSYDPSQRRYAAPISLAFRAGGVVLFFTVFGMVALLFARERRRRSS